MAEINQTKKYVKENDKRTKHERNITEQKKCGAK